jgi:hypothetical protein
MTFPLRNFKEKQWVKKKLRRKNRFFISRRFQLGYSVGWLLRAFSFLGARGTLPTHPGFSWPTLAGRGASQTRRKPPGPVF